jgi:hypothetical protein
MAAERRTAVLIAPARIITNPSTTADNTSAR